MSNEVDRILDSFSLGDLRQILSIKETQAEIDQLLQKRNELLQAVEGIQAQIDRLILSRSRGKTGRKTSYGKRTGPTVRAMCEQVLRDGKKPLTAAELKSEILRRWPEKESPSLYNQVFVALRRSATFRAAGGKFALRDPAASPTAPSQGALEGKESARASG